MSKGGPGRYPIEFGKENFISSDTIDNVVTEEWRVPTDRRKYVIRTIGWWKDYQYRMNRSLKVYLKSCECELEYEVDWKFKENWGWIEINQDLMKKFNNNDVIILQWDLKQNKTKEEINSIIAAKKPQKTEEEKLAAIMKDLGIDTPKTK